MSTKLGKEQRCVSPSPSEDDNLSAASPKRGRKESEQRRRVMMNQYFDELIALLSMLSERCIPKKMDKATTLHEAVQCIQIYSDLTSKPERTLTLDTGGKTSKSSKASPKSPSPAQTEVVPDGSVQGLHTVGELLHFFLDSHDAFLMVISDSGRILYSTELITSLLGHMQTRLVGQNFFDFVHENDHPLFQDLLKLDQAGSGEGLKLKDRPIIAYPPKLVHCHLRLYSGETGYLPQYLQFKSAVYLRKWDAERAKLSSSDISPGSPDPSSSESGYSCDSENQSCLVMIGKLPTSLSMVDLPVGTNDVNFEFEMRISREGRIIDVDKHAVTVLGFTTSEIIGTSFFDYIDPYHLLDVSEGMSAFLSNGLGTTTPYRLQTKGGRSIWLISKGYLSYNPWNNKPDHILLTNRVLGCDQVLPEHRFFRSRKLLPDIEGHESYAPSIPVSRASPPPATPPPITTRSTAIATPDSGVVCNTTEGQFNPASNLSIAQQRSQHPQQQQQQQQQQQAAQAAPQQHLPLQMPNFQPQPHLVRTESSPASTTVQQQQQQQAMLHMPSQQGPGGIVGQQGGAGGNNIHQAPQSTATTPAPAGNPAPPGAGGPPGISTPVTPTPSLQRIDSAGTLLSTAQSPGMLPGTAGGAAAAPSPPQGMPSIQSLEDVQRELERKNREIFEMQKKLFEQQKLFEQERSQFYSITAQVMQCISSSAAMSQITPNMQMVFSTSGDSYSSNNMMNSQPKIVMDTPLQSTPRDPYTGGAVPPANAHTPLWDTSTLDNFPSTCTCSTVHVTEQHYAPAGMASLQQTHPSQHPQHPQQPPQQQQPPQVHTHAQHQHQQQQIGQSPYGATPTTSMPVSTVNFTAVSDYNMPVTVTSSSGMIGHAHGAHQQQQGGGMLSDQFGLSQAFKMSGHQSLAEHNMQFFHQQIPPHQQQAGPQPGPGGQNSGHLAPVSQQSQGGGGSGGGDGYGAMISSILSNLSSPSGSLMNLPSVGSMHPPPTQHSQKSQQQNLPSENLADILSSARFS